MLIGSCCVSFCPQKDIRGSLEKILQFARQQEVCDSEEAFVQLNVDTIQVFKAEDFIVLLVNYIYILFCLFL